MKLCERAKVVARRLVGSNFKPTQNAGYLFQTKRDEAGRLVLQICEFEEGKEKTRSLYIDSWLDVIYYEERVTSPDSKNLLDLEWERVVRLKAIADPAAQRDALDSLIVRISNFLDRFETIK